MRCDSSEKTRETNTHQSSGTLVVAVLLPCRAECWLGRYPLQVCRQRGPHWCTGLHPGTPSFRVSSHR